jgi:hypothetical protein
MAGTTLKYFTKIDQLIRGTQSWRYHNLSLCDIFLGHEKAEMCGRLYSKFQEDDSYQQAPS